ncbi:493_t:CDS:2 [Dentiscutata heterogama]|uniref:493_t:CDS:1 n=1 Tax=Dentiscutata heterogama TaxID=1316150 RepID=A0ACA9KAJ7_9GLOM|nr:493_t:CDS:2 [Dentiscutata heterogama]
MRNQRYPYRKTTPDMREKIVDMVNNQYIPIVKVSHLFHLAPSTIQSIVKRFDEDDRIGHVPWGKLAVKEVATQRGKNITIIAAMSGNGIIKTSYRLGSTTSNNASIYKQVKQIIKKTPHEVIFLPTYLPFLNPIEMVFSKVKNLVAKHPLDSQEKILERIEEAFNKVTKQDCRCWISHSLSYFGSCLNEERIGM